MSFEVELNAATLMLFRDLNSVREFLTLVVSLKLNVLPLSVQTDPKRLKKELPKALKTIKGEDRLMLVGTTNAPFDGELKPMMSTYQKIILIHGQTTPLDTVPFAYQTSLTFPCS